MQLTRNQQFVTLVARRGACATCTKTVDQPAQHCCHALAAPLQEFLRDTWVAGLNKRKINMTN